MMHSGYSIIEHYEINKAKRDAMKGKK